MRVNTDDDIARRVFDRDIPGARLILTVGFVDLYIIKTVVGVFELLHHIMGMIGRVGIDHDDLDLVVRIVLILKISEQTLQRFFFVARDRT